MGNIAVFRSFVSIAAALVIFLPGIAQAQTDEPPQAASTSRQSPYAFSVTPLAGFFWGQGEEQVYRNNYSDDLLSQLLWDIKPLWYLGAALDFSQREPLKNWGGFATLSAKIGISAETGSMEDRDWLTSWSGPELTNYSWHHNNTESAIVLDLAAGISIPLRSLFALRLSLGLSYLHFAWAARDGYYRYGVGPDINNHYAPILDTTPKIPVSGAVISYSQDWLLLPFGLSFAIFPGSRFSGSLYFLAGPALKFAGKDTHHQKVNSGKYSEYVDSMSGGYTLEPGGEFLFSPNERLSLGLHLSWRSITAAPHGESYGAITGPSYPGNFVYFGNYAGGLFKALDFGMSVKIGF